MHTSHVPITLVLTCPINHSQLSSCSEGTKANATGNTLSFEEWAIATINVPLYLPVKNVPSIDNTGRQYVNASMHCPKLQKARRNTPSIDSTRWRIPGF